MQCIHHDREPTRFMIWMHLYRISLMYSWPRRYDLTWKLTLPTSNRSFTLTRFKKHICDLSVHLCDLSLRPHQSVYWVRAPPRVCVKTAWAWTRTLCFRPTVQHPLHFKWAIRKKSRDQTCPFFHNERCGTKARRQPRIHSYVLVPCNPHELGRTCQ